jgi:DNA-binding LytR/AlgR family response regulator
MIDMINCIVIDDEPLALENLAGKIAKIPDLKLLEAFESAWDALPLINAGKIDLVFCDIQMPDISGVSFLKSLTRPPLFIFVTGNPNHAIESYELNVVDYILKPFGTDRLYKSVNRARAFLESQKTNLPHRDFFIIKDRSKNIIMPYNEIIYLKSDREYVTVATIEEKYLMYKRLSEIEESLSSARQFLRVQKSYIVNLDFAKTVDGSYIKMKGSIEDIPIGGQYKAELYKRLGIIGGRPYDC